MLLRAVALLTVAQPAESCLLLLLYSNSRLLPANVEGNRALRVRFSRCADLNIEVASEQAQESRLRAETDADFDRAERRVRLLCAD